MAVAILEEITDQIETSDEFTPTKDFFVAVDKGHVALEAKLPGAAKFYLVGSAGLNTIQALSQAPGTLVKVTPYMPGTIYKLVPQSRKASAIAYQEE